MNTIKKLISITLIGLMLSSNILYAKGTQDKTQTLPIDVDMATASAEEKNADANKGKAPLFDLFNTTQWNLFITEFEIEMEIGFCGCGDVDGEFTKITLDCAGGLKAKMIEPLGYFERSNKPLYFPFADIDLDGNIFQFNNPYYTGQEDQGDSPRENTLFAHFIFFPIFGIIFKKKLNFVCFHKGDLAIPYISEFDPTSKQDYSYMKMVPQMIAMFSPDGLLSTFFDCAATMVVDAVRGYSSSEKFTQLKNLQTGNADSTYTPGTQYGDTTQSIIDFSDKIRNALWFVDGCNGFSPIGQYENGQDPLTETTNSFYGVANILHGASAILKIALLDKQTNANFNGFETQMQKPQKLLNSMCRPQPFPMIIPTQYALQLAYPTVGDAHETGASGVEVSTAKNIQVGSGYVFIPWMRRDYYAFAYFCPGSSSSDGTIENQGDPQDLF